MAVPKAFISYSHDSAEHKQWVLELAKRLMSRGVDVSLDLWDLQPGGDLPLFMEQHLTQADKVLMVCTENYVRKANAGEGGVGYEKMIVTAEMMRKISSTKVIPIIRQAPGRSETPTFLSTKVYLNFADNQFEFSFDELVRTLHEAPLYVKPPIGERPSFDEPPPEVEQTGDPIRMVMQHVINVLERKVSTNIVDRAELVTLGQQEGIARLYFDTILEDAIASGLLSNVGHGFVSLTDKGRYYALKHMLA